MCTAILEIGNKKRKYRQHLYADNSETVIAFYALNRLGAVADMLDPRSNKEQLKFYLKENESKVLILFDACSAGSLKRHRWDT